MKRTVLMAAAGLALSLGGVGTLQAQPAPGGMVEAAPKGLAPDASAAVDQALHAGDQAPLDSVFLDHDGERHNLRDLTAKGPVVLIFYRGGWCPYCVRSLNEFNEQRSAFEAMGATVLAVSGELPEHAKATQEKGEFGFNVWTDPGLDAAQSFGVAFEFKRGRRFLTRFQGEEHNQRLPLGATYVIAPDGSIAWSFLEEDYKRRATTDEVLAAVGKIGG